jgi:hypothetical protein
LQRANYREQARRLHGELEVPAPQSLEHMQKFRLTAIARFDIPLQSRRSQCR